MVNDTPPPIPPRVGIPAGVPADIDLEEIDLGPNYHPNAVVDKREVSHLSSLIKDSRALDVERKGSKTKKSKAPDLEAMFGEEENDFHQPKHRRWGWRRKKEELPDDLGEVSDAQAIRYFHQRPIFRYLAIGVVGVVASVAAAIELTKKSPQLPEGDPQILSQLLEATLPTTEYQSVGSITPISTYNLPKKKPDLQSSLEPTAQETRSTIKAPPETVVVTEYVAVPCDDDPECFGLKLRVSELEAQLSSPAPAEKVFVPIYEKVEVSCDDDPECFAQMLRANELEARLTKEEVSPSPRKVSAPVNSEKVTIETSYVPANVPFTPKSWYERFQTFNKQEFRAAFFEYVTYLGKDQAVQEINRETLFFSFAKDKLNTPEYDLQKRLFSERLFQYVGTNPKEVVACVTHPKSCQ
ncbi:MAG: hypothetical protein WCV90_01265 [Candidatus Woesearchaeota archaeon]